MNEQNQVKMTLQECCSSSLSYFTNFGYSLSHTHGLFMETSWL